MAQMTALSYCSGSSLLHLLDVRCKLICICMMSIAVSQSGWPGLFAINLPLFYFLFSSQIKILSMIRELRFFFLLLFFIFVIRTMVTPGDAVLTVTLPAISIGEAIGITITRDGLIEGSIVCWRFLTLMVLGILFTVTTRPTDLKSAVTWVLNPIPMVPEKRAGMMVSLFIRFFPLILKKAGEVSDAQKARCGHLQRNPVKRTLRMGFPILSRVFRSADVLADAMTARCYSENRTDPPLHSSGKEGYFYIGSLLFSGIAFFVF